MSLSACARQDTGNDSRLAEGGTWLADALTWVVELVIKDLAIAPVSLGNRVPQVDGAPVPFTSITGGTTRDPEFTKMLWSFPLGMEMLKLKYRLSYNWGGKYQGKGAYLVNIQWVPFSLFRDPTLGGDVKIHGEEPTNAGTADDPSVVQRVVITWTLSGIGITTSKVDQFTIYARDGMIVPLLDNWECIGFSCP